MELAAEEALRKLHAMMLRNNQHDEGDLLYYRINYKLADSLNVSKEQAQILHNEYHEKHPREISQGYCDRCKKTVTIIPIIYGIRSEQLEEMQTRMREGRIIIGDTRLIRQEGSVALFGCRECKSPLPNYGMA